MSGFQDNGKPMDETKGIRLVEVEQSDRDQLGIALYLHGYKDAQRVAQEMPSNDGALQMLARHRLAQRYSAAGRAEPVRPLELEPRVVNLVIAAREFWDVNENQSNECYALHKALMAFEGDVPESNNPAEAGMSGNRAESVIPDEIEPPLSLETRSLGMELRMLPVVSTADMQEAVLRVNDDPKGDYFATSAQDDGVLFDDAPARIWDLMVAAAPAAPIPLASVIIAATGWTLTEMSEHDNEGWYIRHHCDVVDNYEGFDRDRAFQKLSVLRMQKVADMLGNRNAMQCADDRTLRLAREVYSSIDFMPGYAARPIMKILDEFPPAVLDTSNTPDSALFLLRNGVIAPEALPRPRMKRLPFDPKQPARFTVDPAGVLWVNAEDAGYQFTTGDDPDEVEPPQPEPAPPASPFVTDIPVRPVTLHGLDLSSMPDIAAASMIHRAGGRRLPEPFFHPLFPGGGNMADALAAAFASGAQANTIEMSEGDARSWLGDEAVDEASASGPDLPEGPVAVSFDEATVRECVRIVLNHSNYGHVEGNSRAFSIASDIKRRLSAGTIGQATGGASND